MAKQRNTPARAPAKSPSSITDISTRAEALEATGNIAGAIKTYRDWIHQAKSPLTWVAQFNLGVLLKTSDDLAGAQEAYAAALLQKPDFAQARINLGLIHELQGRSEDAITEWQVALNQLDKAPTPDPALLCITLNNLGRRLEAMQRYADASAMLTRSLALRPDNEDVLYHWIYLRQRQCEWPIYTPLPGITSEAMVTATSALAMLALSDDPATQLRAASHHISGKWSAEVPRISPTTGYAHDKLRIGYLSSNFGMHPVSFLTAELYELHDRNRFEVYGFCWSPEDNSEMRERVRSAMDHFIRIDQMTDEEAARAIRNAEIDILVDLQGLTAGARPRILSPRPAPVQITYLGFPGTTGLPAIDYVFADRYVIPEESARYFSEKPLYLHDCFQINDRKRVVSPLLSRAEYGLPESAFVFCTFNKNTKFNPDFFAVWMRILKRTPDSVLWLLADNEQSRANLIRYAAAEGIGSERLLFAPRVPLPDYLARYAAADLFLDLSPFNGGTTTTDALWVGLPVLTCAGRSFASRMAGSFLNVIGLPELVTSTLADYENLAVELAHDPMKMSLIRTRLADGKANSPLFDTPTFVKNLETILEQVVIRTKHSEQANAILQAPTSAQRLDQSGTASPSVENPILAEQAAGLVEQLCNIGRELSPSALEELLDFAELLRQKSNSHLPVKPISLSKPVGGLEDSKVIAGSPQA
jgi:predicted O-linked N-acetylglucosamine transferase (SPINDLY family)